MKVNINKTIVLPVALCSCNISSVYREEQRLIIMERIWLKADGYCSISAYVIFGHFVKDLKLPHSSFLSLSRFCEDIESFLSRFCNLNLRNFCLPTGENVPSLICRPTVYV